MDWIGQKYTYTKFKRQRKIGDITVNLPAPPPRQDVAGHDLPKAKQKFTYTELPGDIDFWLPEKRREYVDREWDRRKNGYWFFNNGYLEYITGLHYFYLNYWKFPVKNKGKKRLGLPSFVDSDRDFFYAWEEVVKNENCYGLYYICNRREGKSYRGTCMLYEAISKTPEALGGIQSKTNADGKKVFLKIVKAWQKLPSFWKPIDSGDSNPQSALKFEEPSERHTKRMKRRYTNVLRSQINFAPAKDEAYDGDDLFRVYHDEIGKTPESEADVNNRWDIVKECLSDGSDITGKALLTTTVEDIDGKGIVRAKKLWGRSNPLETDEFGQTDSGLWKLFKPSYYGFRGDDKEDKKSFIDEYGYSDIEAAIAFFEKRFKKKDTATLISLRRKYPQKEADIWMVENKQAPFDLDRIYAQLEYNSTLPKSITTPGNFVWAEQDKEARFVHDNNGRWKVAWMPDEGKRNNTVVRNGKICPGNLDIVSGVDPFDHRITTDNRRSDAASHVLRKFDPFDPFNTGVFVSEYLARPDKPEIFYEDMIIQCFFYGCEILAENNKIGIINYFRMRGYEKFLMKRPEPTQTPFSATKRRAQEYGIPMAGEEAIEALINAIQTYVYDHIGYNKEKDAWGKMYFDRTLEDWAQFDPNNRTPFDATMSSGLTLLGARKYVRPIKEKPEDVPELIRSYRVVGNKSVLIKP